MAEMEIRRNERVVAMDGMEVGHVTHVIVDHMTHQVTDLVVQHDGQEQLVPISNVERATSGEIMLRGIASQVGNALLFDREGYHEVDTDELDMTSTQGMPGAAVVEHADRDSVVIESPMAGTTGMTEAMPATERVTERTERTTETTAPVAGRTTDRVAREGENITVPVVEERLTAGVREQEAGRFRLVKRVVQEQQNIDVPVQREEAYITERTVNRRPATEADLAAMDRDIEVPLREQEVVTSKDARVVGEVDVRKETVTDTQRVTDTVRREQVHVEGGNTERVHVEGLTTDQRTRYETMNEADRARYGRFTDAERMEYDALTPERQRTYAAEYDRRNPLQKAADAITGNNDPNRR